MDSGSVTCPICDSVMRGPRAHFRYDCPRCRFSRANLPVLVNATAKGSDDETAFEAALAQLRARNFEILLDRLERFIARPGRSLLEVGCAYGSFLEAAQRRGYRVHGIEPDATRAARAAERVPSITTGFFPGDIPRGAQFDAVVFNDVFEHLPDPVAAILGIDLVLKRGGVVVVNLPSSHGIFYRIAHALSCLGIRGPHDRMWQVGFPSPHLSYFHPRALARLFERHRYVEVERGTLPSFELTGLWHRLRYNSRSSLLFSAVAWLAITVSAPLLQRLPADISVQFFRRADTPLAEHL